MLKLHDLGNLRKSDVFFFPPLVENVASETSNEVESKKEEEGERVVEGGGEEGEVFCTLLVAASLHSIEVELYKVREGGRERRRGRGEGGRGRGVLFS